jgi:hypothetical protein
MSVGVKSLVTVIALSLLSLGSARPALAELPFGGYLEYAVSGRYSHDSHAEDDMLLNEARFQIEIEEESDLALATFRADFVSDAVLGDDYVEVREASISASPLDSVDIKVGRQVLTWGTGDLVFLNDLFPKDWQSFFIGRDDEYLKKPSDAIKAGWFGDWLSVDLVWSPTFTPDSYITGERISFYNPMAGGLIGPKELASPQEGVEPDRSWGNGELATRVYAMLGGWEGALYGYRGRFGQPKGFDPVNGVATFARLEAWGASAVGAVWGGVMNFETSWYRSLDDSDGDDPYQPNSQLRGLAGFTREIFPEHTLGMQLYLEKELDVPVKTSAEPNDERWWVTARYRAMAMQQNLVMSLFALWSPDEKDVYLRPKITYKASDELALTLGGIIFEGDEGDTFFGQFEGNSNVYGRVRYSF